jgi:protein O-mannosyl-transferase
MDGGGGGPAQRARGGDGRWLGLALAAVVLAYGAAVTGGFVWDDYTLIQEERLVTSPGRLDDYFGRFLWSGPLQASRAFYRPLITLSYAADYQLWDGRPAGFHLTNVVLHLLVTVLVWQLIRRAGAGGGGGDPAGRGERSGGGGDPAGRGERSGGGGDPTAGGRGPVWAALAAGFALAPRLTESVAWISGRTDVAAAIGALGAMVVHRPGPGRWERKGVAAALLLFGLLCKEVAIAGTVAVLALELCYRQASRERWHAPLLRAGPALAALALYAGLRLRAGALDGTAPAGAAEFGWRTPGAVAMAFAEAVGRYAVMLLDPFQPQVQMGMTGFPAPAFCLLGAALVLLALLWIGRRAWTRRPPALTDQQWAALALGATALGLVVHLVPLNVNAVASDRFLYLPLAGLAIAAAPAAARVWHRRPRQAALVASLLVGGFAVATTLRTLEWADELRLWRGAIREAHPRNVIGQLSLAHAYMQRGRWADALGQLHEVTRIHPSYIQQPTFQGNLALCLDKLGQRQRALSLLTQAVARHPERLRLHYHLLMAHARDLRFDRAREVAASIQRRFPDDQHTGELLKVISRAQSALAALPPPRPDEPPALRAARAGVYADLAAPAEAAPLWAQVATAPDAPAPLRERAVGYLVSQADPTLAARVLDRLTAHPPGGMDLGLYRAVLIDRLGDGDAYGDGDGEGR